MAITSVGQVATAVNATGGTLAWATAGGGSAPATGDFAVLAWNGSSGVTWISAHTGIDPAPLAGTGSPPSFDTRSSRPFGPPTATAR